MKKLLTTLLLVLAGSVLANAQLLYRISGKGLDKPSYVFGTFHIANTPFVDKVAGVRQALDETSQVYGEIKWDDMTNADSLRSMQEAMMLPEGQTLKTLLTAEQYQRLDKMVTELMGVGLSNPMVAQQMGRLKPAVINTQLTMLMYMKAHMGEFDPTNMIDQYFQLQAKNNNEPVGGLETIAFQSDLLYNGDLKRQVTQLDCLMGNTDFYAQQMEQMAKAYYAQDIKTLYEVMDEKLSATCDATPDEKADMLDRRNVRWAEKMPAIMKAAPTLFVIGAGHLPGEQGIVTLLQKKGYAVEAVK